MTQGKGAATNDIRRAVAAKPWSLQRPATAAAVPTMDRKLQ